MDDLELGETLYVSFWNRNGGADKAPPFSDQAEAIRTMWINIAASAREALGQSPTPQ